MGTFLGHALAGLVFILFGVWWSFKMNYRKYIADVKRNRFGSSATFRCIFLCARVRDWPIEGCMKILLTTIGGIAEIATAFDDHGNFTHMGNAQHATIYFLFALNGVIDVLLYFRVSLPRGLDYVSLSLAFVVDFLLFKFHLHGRPPIDVLIHTLLVYVIGVTVVVVLLEMCFPQNFLFALTRAYFTILHGTWLWQIAFILYNPRGGWKLWDLVDPKNVIVATMYLAWHMAAILIYMVAVSGLVKYYVTRRYGPIDEIEMNPLLTDKPDDAGVSLFNGSDSEAGSENPVGNNATSEPTFTGDPML